ncbi:MAG: transporter related [Anaerocolumna sp.]|jgi:ATP-binding cassette subfamily B protein|nr:transporter related [Anaerocolumna sp.]
MDRKVEEKEVEVVSQFSEEENEFLRSFHKNENKPLKTLIGLYKGNYSKLIGSTVFFVIKHSPVWLLPIATANIINAATNKESNGFHVIVINIIVMIVLMLQNVPTNFIHTRLYSRAIRYVEAGLRGSLVRKLQQLSISFHKEMQSGRLQSKIMRDVEAIETLSSQLFISLLNILLNVVVALTITVSKSIIVFFFFLLTIPVAVAIIVVFRKKIKEQNSEFRKEMEETSARVMEMVELIPVTRAHGLEKQEIVKMETQLNRVAEKGYRLDMVQSFFGSVSWVAFQIFQIVCLGFTGYLAYKGKITVGEVVLYQTYFTSIVNQVSGVITLLPTISKGMESVRSVGDILLAHDVENNKGKKKIKDIKGEINFENVVFHYKDNDKSVLNGLNLNVKAGETIALVGESGAGKSTILNLVIGFNKIDSGKITIDGLDIDKIDLHSYRKHLAVVPQNTILFSGTIRDNITYGLPSVSDDELMRVVEAANLTDLVKSLPDGVDTKISEHGGNLSGGQRQRISIARALVRDPRIIVLDEATSALDSISEKKIQIAINNLAKGRTTFIVAHRLSTIRDADRIAVINGGVCKEIGTYEELMEKKGEFYKFKQLQA